MNVKNTPIEQHCGMALIISTLKIIQTLYNGNIPTLLNMGYTDVGGYPMMNLVKLINKIK